MRAVPSILWLLIVGCGATSVRDEERGLAGPLAVWTTDARGHRLAVPRVEVSLNGHPVDVMLDTGASQHFVLNAAAWAYRVDSQPFGALATDAHGVRFEVRVARAGSLRVPGRPYHVPAHLFLLDSRPLWASGVLGGLSPQLLAPAGYATVLDLRGGRLDVVRERALEARDRARNGWLCRAGEDPRDGWRYVAPVRVAGRTVPMLVDTGAETTTLYERAPSAPILLAAGRRTDVRVAGAASIARMVAVNGVAVEAGGASVTGLVTVGPGDAQCDEQGLLGFDFLRRCRLVLRRDGVALRCAGDEPAPHGAPERTRADPIVLASVVADPGCGRSAAELRPRLQGRLPMEYPSAVDAYVALRDSVQAHSTRIEETCRDHGYLEARIREPVLARRGSQLVVRFRVDEGRRFTVGRVTIVISSPEAERSFEGEVEWMRTRSGEPYADENVAWDTFALSRALVARRTAVTRASFTRSPSTDATVDVRIELGVEGEPPLELADLDPP